MKRLQIYIDEASDEALTHRARKEGRSKAALIREAVQREYGIEAGDEPFDAWAGGIDEVPGDVDELVYQR